MYRYQSLRRGWPWVVPLAVVLALPATSAAAAPDDAASAASPSLTAPAGAETVTLVTGDRVTVQQTPDRRFVANVDPAPRDGGEPAFETIEAGEQLYVLPSDAVPLVPDVLDPELFNVTKLVEAGYTDGLPVIVTLPDDAGTARRAAGMPGATVTSTLSSIDAVAATVEPGGAWWDGMRAAARRPGSAQRAMAGVEKVWLDELVEVALDESAPLVGAPQAWAAGFDGTGMRVAVLDTGIDDTHPDLAGKVVAADNFTSEPDETDEHGHGTHVAGIAAGVATASGGTYTGVAPGAELLNGKICNRFGNCLTSWILDGMEWAAPRADVINMSVGTFSGSDGTDPASQAVNALSAQHDVLFVISAGNSGLRGDGSVGSPGAADAALTVGSVDKSEQLAPTSSRGPRLGDFAIKPDVTAPGVDIVSARADGTSLGTPVDDDYTMLSGTSMAAPHVAGAAAILLQQDPELGPAELKSALVSTGVPHPELDVYEQGGGRLDIPAALDAPVRATPAPLDLGFFQWPHEATEPVQVEAAYTNRTEQELTLDLALDVASRDGDLAPESMLSVTPTTLVLPAGGTGSATVTLDVREGEVGTYGGSLVASSDGAVVARTPVGFTKEPEHFDLTVRAIDTEGGAASGAITAMNVDDPDAFFELSVSYDAAGVASLRVPEGTYAVYGWADTHPAGESLPTVRTAMAEPELVVDGDTEVVFDARTANQITVEAPAHDVALWDRMGFTLFREAATGFRASRGLNTFAEGVRFQAAPTDPVSTGDFEFVSRWQLRDPDDPVDSAVVYDVVFPELGAISETLDYVAHPDALGSSAQGFHTHVADHPVREFRHWWRPWQGSSLAIAVDVGAPIQRTEYLAPADTSWTRTLLFAPPGFPSLAGRMNAPRMEYQPGEPETRDWMKQPVTPGMIEGSPWHPTFPQFREGDTLELFISEFTDSTPGHWGWYQGALDDAAFRLYEDGELVAEEVRPRGEFPLSGPSSRVRVEADVSRDVSWWKYSTRTATAWEFDSHRPAEGQTEIVPFLLVDYDLDLDLRNVAPHPRDLRGPYQVGLQVRHQPGADQVPIAGARLWVSYDDGATWRERPGQSLGGGEFTFPIDARDPAETNGFVALRVEAWDEHGNRIEQEVIRAYGLPAR